MKNTVLNFEWSRTAIMRDLIVEDTFDSTASFQANIILKSPLNIYANRIVFKDNLSRFLIYLDDPGTSHYGYVDQYPWGTWWGEGCRYVLKDFLMAQKDGNLGLESAGNYVDGYGVRLENQSQNCGGWCDAPSGNQSKLGLYLERCVFKYNTTDTNGPAEYITSDDYTAWPLGDPTYPAIHSHACNFDPGMINSNFDHFPENVALGGTVTITGNPAYIQTAAAGMYFWNLMNLGSGGANWYWQKFQSGSEYTVAHLEAAAAYTNFHLYSPGVFGFDINTNSDSNNGIFRWVMPSGTVSWDTAVSGGKTGIRVGSDNFQIYSGLGLSTFWVGHDSQNNATIIKDNAPIEYTGQARPTDYIYPFTKTSYATDWEGAGGHDLDVSTVRDSTTGDLYIKAVPNQNTQSETIAWECYIPEDFDGFSGNMTIDTYADDFTNSTISITIEIGGSADSTINSLDITPSSDYAWEGQSSAFGTSWSSSNAGDRCIITITFSGDTNDVMRVRNLKLPYYRKYA